LHHPGGKREHRSFFTRHVKRRHKDSRRDWTFPNFAFWVS
jgi:hypothetical protein